MLPCSQKMSDSVKFSIFHQDLKKKTLDFIKLVRDHVFQLPVGYQKQTNKKSQQKAILLNVDKQLNHPSR